MAVTLRPMTRARAAVLVFAALLLAPPAAALGQSAGDDQYQDPFGGTQTSGSSSPSKGRGSGGSGGGLTQTPDLGGPAGGGAAGTGTAGTGTAGAAPVTGDVHATPAAGQLPVTGVDAPLLALSGLALLLGGVGLRLRTADERF